MFQANDKDTRIILPEAILVIFVDKFEHALVSWDVLKATLQKNFETYLHLKVVQEFSKKHVAQFLHNKTVVCSVYSKTGSFTKRGSKNYFYFSGVAVGSRKIHSKALVLKSIFVKMLTSMSKLY